MITNPIVVDSLSKQTRKKKSRRTTLEK